VEDECRDIEEGIDTQDGFTYSEFKKPELSRPLLISIAIMFFQQFSGPSQRKSNNIHNEASYS
jgi:hypothetical protein